MLNVAFRCGRLPAETVASRYDPIRDYRRRADIIDREINLHRAMFGAAVRHRLIQVAPDGSIRQPHHPREVFMTLLLGMIGFRVGLTPVYAPRRAKRNLHGRLPGQTEI